MTQRQLFKFAFISRCIEAGLVTPQAISEVLEKQAEIPGLGMATKGIDWLLDKSVKGIGLGLVAPPILGVLGGYGAGTLMNRVDDTDEDDAKNDELVDEYRRQAQIARRRAMLQQYNNKRQRSGRVFL